MQLSILDRVIDKLKRARLTWASTEAGIRGERGLLYRELNGISGCKPRSQLCCSVRIYTLFNVCCSVGDKLFWVAPRWINKRLGQELGNTAHKLDYRGAISVEKSKKPTTDSLSPLWPSKNFPIKPKMLFHTVTSDGSTAVDSPAFKGFPHSLVPTANSS